MSDSTKEIALNEHRYQLRKMTPLVAGRIHNWLVAGMAKLARENASEANSEQPESDGSVPVERAEGMVASIWVLASTLFSEELCEKVQTHCLQSCSEFPDSSDAPAVPIMMANGRWASPRLEQDPVAVNQLVLAALKFNIAPFFIGSISSLVPGA